MTNVPEQSPELLARQLEFDKRQRYNEQAIGVVSDIYFENWHPVPYIAKTHERNGRPLSAYTINYMDAFKFLKPGESFTAAAKNMQYVKKAAEEIGVSIVYKSCETRLVRVWVVTDELLREAENRMKKRESNVLLVGDKHR